MTSFSKATFTSEGVVSHNVLYYQQLSITCNQFRVYANNYFEYLPTTLNLNYKKLKKSKINKNIKTNWSKKVKDLPDSYGKHIQ